MKPAVKVCGVSDPAFAAEAAGRGVEYLGFIFAAGSPRRVTVGRAKEIRAAVERGRAARPPRFVGVFVEQRVDEMLEIAAAVPLDVIQVHRSCGADETARLKSAGFEVWRLFRPGTVPADAVLLDGRDGNRSGGTGKLADWSLVAELKRGGARVVLAGGISAENVAAAARTGADVLDVNSSIETAPGVKSVELLDALLAGAPVSLRPPQA